MDLDQNDAPEEAPEPEVEAPAVEASEVEASVHGQWYRILSDRMVYGGQGSVVHLDLDNDTALHLIGAGHLAVESGPEPE